MATKTAPFGDIDPVGFQKITDLATPAKSLTIPDDATFCDIQVETQEVYFRDDGVAASATVGMLLEVKKILRYTGDLTQVSLFEKVAGAVANISYYK